MVTGIDPFPHSGAAYIMPTDRREWLYHHHHPHPGMGNILSSLKTFGTFIKGFFETFLSKADEGPS
jgi:hypothetical protein